MKYKGNCKIVLSRQSTQIGQDKYNGVMKAFIHFRIQGYHLSGGVHRY